MSQLPWGGRPTSPVDDPDNTTGPGQGAPAGPQAGNEACDCVCPDYGESPWLPVPDTPYDGPGGDPNYDGTYYRLKRCRDDADQPAWVQSNEFSPGDVILLTVNSIATCFYVDSTEVANDQVQDSNVVRPNDVTQDYDNCTACRAVSDPDGPGPPVLATSYAQLAFCADDTLAPLWTPVEVFGIPVNEDLTKIYKIANVCYYISNNIQPTPGGPLMPVFAASVFDDCLGCAPPCTTCDPGGAGNATGDWTFGGAVDDFGSECPGPHTFTWAADGSFTSTPDRCKWLVSGLTPLGGIIKMHLVFVKRNYSDTIGCTSNTLTAGKWYVGAFFEDESTLAVSNWEYEETTGFACSGSTGKVSGGHTFVNGVCFGDGCSGKPTIAIAP